MRRNTHDLVHAHVVWLMTALSVLSYRNTLYLGFIFFMLQIGNTTVTRIVWCAFSFLLVDSSLRWFTPCINLSWRSSSFLPASASFVSSACTGITAWPKTIKPKSWCYCMSEQACWVRSAGWLTTIIAIARLTSSVMLGGTSSWDSMRIMVLSSCNTFGHLN